MQVLQLELSLAQVLGVSLPRRSAERAQAGTDIAPCRLYLMPFIFFFQI